MPENAVINDFYTHRLDRLLEISGVKAQLEAQIRATTLMSVISLLDSDDNLARELRSALRTGPRIDRIRFRRNVAESRFIEDALIYRAA